MSETVYFVENAITSAIKIGYTRNLPKRLVALKCAAQGQVNLIASIPGNRKAERYFHQKLASHRLDGEWFAPSSEVLELIEQVKDIGAKYLPPDCEPTPRPSREVRRMRNDEIRMVCRTYVYGIGYPMGIDESKPAFIKRVAGITGLEPRTIKSIWYREPHTVSAFTLLTLRKHFVLRFKAARVLRGLHRTGTDDGEKE